MSKETQWPLGDLVAVIRNTLVEGGAWRSRRPYPPLKPQHQGAAPPNVGGESEGRIYPFTKGLELTNDGIGYGEQTTVKVLRCTGDTTEQLRRRTRTGSILIDPVIRPARRSELCSAHEPLDKASVVPVVGKNQQTDDD